MAAMYDLIMIFQFDFVLLIMSLLFFEFMAKNFQIDYLNGKIVK